MAKKKKPWYRINLNLRRRLRELRQRRRDHIEQNIREQMSLYDRAPEEAENIFLALRRGARSELDGKARS
jgi:hypothetical protein